MSLRGEKGRKKSIGYHVSICDSPAVWVRATGATGQLEECGEVETREV